MDNCSHNKDLNPYTCRFVQKCKDNFERDENFKCKKKVTFKLKAVKPKNNTRKIPYIESPILNVSTPESLLFENDAIKSVSNHLEEKTSHEKSIRVFPIPNKLIEEKDKKYVVFENGGTGIMLADNLYKDGKMIQLSKKLKIDPPIGWYASEKYDGLRGIWTGKELVSRPTKTNGVLKGKCFNYVPQWFTDILPKNVSLDGELWLGRGLFQKISGLGNYKIGKKITQEYLDSLWKDVKFMIFDVPHIDKPFVERLDVLKTIIQDINIKYPQQNNVVLVEPIQINSEQHLSTLYGDYITNGAEGIILRHPNSKYEPKRSKLLLKMKLNADAEAIVVEHVLGTGKYKSLLGSLKCKLENGKTFNIGTGFTDSMRREYNDSESKHYIPIGAKVNFSYMEMTQSGIPRHPVYRGIRNDV